jgi:hypothetical protein
VTTVELAPVIIAAARERSLGRVDPAERPLVDGDGATGQDGALEHALVELLFVVVVLVVAIIEPADRRIAPVHDGQAVAIVEHRALADEHVPRRAALGLAEPQMPEVGVLRVDGETPPLSTRPLEGCDLVHLVDE